MNEEQKQELVDLTIAVINERDKILGMSHDAHYFHHQWIQSQIQDQRDFRTTVKEAAIKWGVVSLLAATVWAIWEIIKHKLGIT